jgi:hypothetical protein
MVDQVLATSAPRTRLAERAIPRFFAVREPRQHVLERLPYDLCPAEGSAVQ